MATSCVNHEDVQRACRILNSLMGTLHSDSVNDDHDELAVLKQSLTAMQSHTFAHLIDIRRTHQKTVHAASEFITASVDKADPEFTNDAALASQADGIHVRYGIEANRARLPTPEPREVSLCRPVSTMSTTSQESTDDALLAKLRDIEFPGEEASSGDSPLLHHSPMVKARLASRQRVPLGSLESSSGSVNPPPFMPGSNSGYSLLTPNSNSPCRARSALSIASERHMQHSAIQVSDPPRQSGGPAVLQPLVQSSGDELPSPLKSSKTAPSLSLNDSLVFMRRKSSLSEVEQAVSSRRRRTVVMCAGVSEGLGLEVVGSMHHGLFISSVSARSHAERCGLREFDQILAVNGKSLAGKSAGYFAELIQERRKEEIFFAVQYNRAGHSEFLRDVSHGYAEEW